MLANAKDEYPEMTNEEYKKKLTELFADIEENQILRFFYIFANEKMKGVR